MVDMTENIKAEEGVLYLTYNACPHSAHKYQFEILKGRQLFLRKGLIPASLHHLVKQRYVVLSEGWRPSIYACLLRSLGTAKVHINIMFGDFIYSFAKNPLLKGIVAKLYQNYVDAVITNSSLTYELARKVLTLEKEKLFICWPVSPKIHIFRTVEPVFELNIDKLHVCYLGHMTRQDGADLLPAIYYRLKEEFRKVKMYIIGSPTLKEHELFKKLLSISKREENFKVLGQLPDEHVKKIFTRCIFLVYPARFKAFGLPVVEAMSAGLVPIITRNVGARDFVLQLLSKLVAKTSEEIAKIILEVYTRGISYIKELSHMAKHIALSYDEKIAKKRFIRILETVLLKAKR